MCRCVTEGSDCLRVLRSARIHGMTFVHALATDASGEKAGCGKEKIRFWVDCRQPLLYRITEGLPVIRPESMASAEIPYYKPTLGS